VTEREGVIQFDLRYRAGPPPPEESVAVLDGWRGVLHRLQLIGRDPARYGGLGFGNVSHRMDEGFIISGTQTGDREALGVDGYCRVTACDPTANRVDAIGPVRPSSEALTHGAVYRARPQVDCVLHGHSAEIWQRAASLGLAATDPQVTYGTPAMAAEVARLLDVVGMAEAGVFAMGGHEDGIIAFGPDEDTAGGLLVATLARALADALLRNPQPSVQEK